MRDKYKRWGVLLMAAAMICACQPMGGKSGIHVMFDAKPHIVDDNVYWHGKTIGAVAGIENGKTAITRVTVTLDSQFKAYAGHHWAFYVDKGRLMADRHSTTGKQLATGEAVCGFSSKAALNWFKVKTLLNDRVANAMRRAASLQQRFG